LKQVKIAPQRNQLMIIDDSLRARTTVGCHRGRRKIKKDKNKAGVGRAQTDENEIFPNADVS